MERVVITGLGWISALGPDLRTTWSGLVAGKNGIRPITYFDASLYNCKVAAEVPDIGCETGLAGVPLPLLRRSVRLYVKSALEAWRDAGLPLGAPANSRWGVSVGASVNYLNQGWLKHHLRFCRQDRSSLDLGRLLTEGGCNPPELFYRRLGDMYATVPAKMLGIAGPSATIDAACAGSSFAICDAYRRLQRGEVDLVLSGGATGVVSPIAILSFMLLGALSSNPSPDEASRPFDKNRDGFVMGEAGGAIVLETLDHARARGARIYAELVGTASTMSAINLTDPSPDGSAEGDAMRLAIEDAGIAPEEIGYVAAHGTSTPKNDVVETLAIKRTFGSHAGRLLVSSNKGQLGHTLAAAGVCNVICATQAISEGVVPPTAHLRTPDPDCDLDYVPDIGRTANIEAAVANAFAFGGQNAAVVVRRFR
jgi:3-oxoacyl-[acyl-carrier-protein] synthase II